MKRTTAGNRLFSPRVALWLMGFFMLAQTLAAAHTAAYGKADHMHDGHPCIVASIHKHSADMDLAEAPTILVPENHGTNSPLSLVVTPEGHIRPAGTIRAPPAQA